MIATPPVLALVLTLGAADALRAQACATAEHRQFDFVVGNWLVSDRSGSVVGTVTITAEYRRCVLIEKWRGVGDAGEGLGVVGYRSESKAWHRDFIDRAGFVLALDGKSDGASMVMTGKDYHNPDVMRMHRVTWSARRDGTVEEQWRTSIDAGQTWQVHRYALLRRIAE